MKVTKVPRVIEVKGDRNPRTAEIAADMKAMAAARREQRRKERLAAAQAQVKTSVTDATAGAVKLDLSSDALALLGKKDDVPNGEAQDGDGSDGESKE